MIVRQHSFTDGRTGENRSLWGALSAPLPHGVISWRQDGKATQRDGKFFARFVCYIEANTVRERLDSVAPGEWDLTLELLPSVSGSDDGEVQCAFKARLQILGVIREDVGTGRDYKSAATDAFKRAAVRFGIGHELYAYEQNWVEVDGDGRYAKPVEDPAMAYERRYGRGQVTSAGTGAEYAPGDPIGDGHGTTLLTDLSAVSCPKCGGRMWDNRLTKRNPKAPDYKCRNRSCDGVIWPARGGEEEAVTSGLAMPADRLGKDGHTEMDDEIPF